MKAYYSGILQSVDDTNITIVGGTTLSTTGAGGPYASETVWNAYSNGGGTGASAAESVSTVLQFQAGRRHQHDDQPRFATLRNVPDVAINADNILSSRTMDFGICQRTSAAHRCGGFTALVNQQAVTSGKATVGFINPAIYAIGKSPFYLSDFHDITTGNNTN